jgi:hypothetical protein
MAMGQSLDNLVWYVGLNYWVLYDELVMSYYETAKKEFQTDSSSVLTGLFTEFLSLRKERKHSLLVVVISVAR